MKSRLIRYAIEYANVGIRIQEKEIPGGFPGEGDEKGKYVRVMRNIPLTDESSVEKVTAQIRTIR